MSHSALHARASAAHMAVNQYLGMLRLGALLQARDASWPGPAPGWAAHLEQTRAQVAAGGASDLLQSGGEGLGWSPAAAAAAAGSADLSLAGVRRVIHTFIKRAGHLYM